MAKFLPGQSGNPGGKPKGVKNNDLVLRILERTKNGDILIDLMMDIVEGREETAEASDKIKAAYWLADRCWGKPVESVVHHEGTPFPQIGFAKVG